MEKIYKITDTQYFDNLSDESRIQGFADSISFPSNEDEAVDIINYMRSKKINVTVQGGRTGLSGGAVPFGGHIMNMSRMSKITGIKYLKDKDEFIISLQPGVLLKELNEAIKIKEKFIPLVDKKSQNTVEQLNNLGKYFFPPDPTETLASMGGIVSTNAAGPLSYAYGSVRKYINQIRVVLSDGTPLCIDRGKNRCNKRTCNIGIKDKNYKFELPEYNFNSIKNSTGYFSQEDMDLIDLFIGAEGTLGIITSIDIRVIKEPQEKFKCICFFKNNIEAIKFANMMKTQKNKSGIINVVALEYIDKNSMQLVNQKRSDLAESKIIPEIDMSFEAGIYFELHSNNSNELESAIQKVVDMIEICGGDIENTWVSQEERKLDPLKVFRHAIPESANVVIGEYKLENPDITTICIDMSVKEKYQKELIGIYQKDLDSRNIKYIIYGHIGNNHLHVNILPKDIQEYEISLELYRKWAQKVAGWGGILSAEHGIGKQKVDMLRYFVDNANLKKMEEIKRIFDGENILNRNTLFNSRVC